MWTPENPEINNDDILAYSEYLKNYATGNLKIPPSMFSKTLDGFFWCHRCDDSIDGKTRGQWIDYKKKQFVILEPMRYEIYYLPDGYEEENGHIMVTKRCAYSDQGVNVPWGRMDRFVKVKGERYSQQEIEEMGLPIFDESCYDVLE